MRDDQLRLIFTCCHPAPGPARPGRAHPAPARRAGDPGDRPGLPGARADDGPADRPGQEEDPRRRGSRTGCPDDAELPDRLPAGARRALPDLQRGLRGRPAGRTWCATTCAPRRSAWPGCCAELMPDEPEAPGLLALLLLTESRRPARDRAGRVAGAAGRPGPQSLWDRALIAEGHAAGPALPAPQPARAVPDPGRDQRRAHRRADRGGHRLGADPRALRPAARARRRRRWSRSTGPSPWPRCTGPAPALAEVDGLDLPAYHLFHATRADLLRRLGRAPRPRPPTTRRSRAPTTRPNGPISSAGGTA